MRDIRVRARSVKQTLQVTTAMKLISTSKLRKARRRLDETRPYFEAIRDTLHDIVERMDGADIPWFDARPSKKERVQATLVITSELDLLCDEGEAYARKLQEAWNDVELVRIDGALHGFITLPRFSKPLRTAYERINTFLDIPLSD